MTNWIDLICAWFDVFFARGKNTKKRISESAALDFLVRDARSFAPDDVRHLN